MERAADQTVAFIVGHVHRKTGRKSLLENIQLTGTGCIVHASCKSNHLRREAASVSHFWLDLMIMLPDGVFGFPARA